MQVKIDRVSDVKQGQYGMSSKIYFGDACCYINSDGTNLIGKMVDLETTEKFSKTGNKYLVGKVSRIIENAAPVAPSQNGNGNGKITWDAYRAMAEAAHELASKLEPDEFTVRPDENSDMAVNVRADRAAARAAILNTVMIAYSNGKIVVPNIDDDLPDFLRDAR